MSYLFTSESVSEGHPDKVADQISDAILDEFLTADPDSKVACETLVTTGLVMLAGEIKSNAYVDVQSVARKVIERIGYTRSEYMFDANSCAVISALHEQSPEISQGVERSNPEEQGAGDQGMMFGYATNETDNYMPLALSLSHLLLQELAAIRKEGRKMKYLRPDAKSQVTIEYSDQHKPVRIDTIVLSTQHDDFPGALKTIEADIKSVLLPRVKKALSRRMQRLFTPNIQFHVNPTGKFVIGWPHGDSGLTGRKIIVDTYGGKGAHGGGAFSGKDASKVDRSAAYAARYLAKNLVAAGVADQALVQVAYAIGVARPVGLYVTTYGTTKITGKDGKKVSDGEIASRLKELFDLCPYNIVRHFGLKNPIFSATAAYGHMGRIPEVREINGKKYETFTWEKLDLADKIRETFNIAEPAAGKTADLAASNS